MRGLRIIVLGYVVRGPVGGLAWHHLQYVMGLARLGHDVYFVEDSDDYPSCYDPSRHVTDTDPTYGLCFATDAFARVGFGDRWAYFDAHTSRWHGPCADQIGDVCKTADLVLNLSGMNPLRASLMDVPARVLVDTDPGFTQIRHLTDPAAYARAVQHTSFFSFAENIRTNRATIPDDGFPWEPTRQPIVLDAWRVTPGPADGCFSTVMLWDSYTARTYDGRTYGMKSASFEPFVDMPKRSRARFQIALGSPTAPSALLRRYGWTVEDPLDVSRDPWTYQAFIRASKAEFSVAKHGYVASRSGWFSERSAAYLASGRPVVLQETGFTSAIPNGNGLLSFTEPDEAIAAIEDVTRRYAHHCRAARDLAEEYFDARRILERLIEHANSGCVVTR